MKAIALNWFSENPSAKDGVMKAYFAYHAQGSECHPNAHKFWDGSRESTCQWCGRSREQVRHDELPAQCQLRPMAEPVQVEDIIRKEEVSAFGIFEKAKTIVPRFVSKFGMSGKTLADLHKTHGFDPETVAGIVDVPPSVLAGYYLEMEQERAMSRARQVKQTITVAV